MLCYYTHGLEKLPFFFFIFICWYLRRYKEILYTPLYKADVSPDAGLSLFHTGRMVYT